MTTYDDPDPLGALRDRIADIHRTHPVPVDDGRGLRELLRQADLRQCSPEFRALAGRFLDGHAAPADVRRHPDYARIVGERLAERRED